MGSGSYLGGNTVVNGGWAWSGKSGLSRPKKKTPKQPATTIRSNIQMALCNVAGHAYECGDVSAFDRLLAVSTGLSKRKIIRWVHEYGFARYNEKTGNFSVNKKMKNATHFGNGANTKDSSTAVVTHLTKESINWYDMTGNASTEDKPLDITQSIVALRKRIEKAIENGQEIKSDEVEGAMRLLEAKVKDV